MATQSITYGTTIINLARVSYTGQAVYDETDRILRHHVVSFSISGVVYGTGATDMDATEAMRDTAYVGKTALEQSLSLPRQIFEWDLNGVKIFSVNNTQGVSAPAEGIFTDLAQGPKPRNVAVQQITGGRSYRVSMTIDVAISFVDPGALVVVDSFSYAFSFAYDKNFTATRTVQGNLGIRMTEVSADRNIADIFVSGKINGASTAANQYMPALPRGWERDGWNYSVSPDGSRLAFSCVDRQRWRVLPALITSGNCTMTIQQSGPMISKQMSGFFQAPENVNKQLLIDVVTSLIQWRFKDCFSTSSSVQTERLTSFQITNYDFENRIDFSVSSTRSAAGLLSGGTLSNTILGSITDIANAQSSGAVSGSANFGNISTGDAAVSGTAGTAGIIMSASNPFNVSSPVSANPDINGVANPTNNTNSGHDTTFTPGPGTNPVVPDSGGLSEEQLQYPYSSYTDAIQFVLDYQNVILSTATNDFTIAGSPNGFNNPDTVQQVCRPRLLVIHAGTARRIGAMPVIPKAYIFAPNAILLRTEPRLMSPRFMADGQSLEFCCQWNDTYYVPAITELQGLNGSSAYAGAAGKLTINRPPSQQINENLPIYDGTRPGVFDGGNPTIGNQGNTTLTTPPI